MKNLDFFPFHVSFHGTVDKMSFFFPLFFGGILTKAAEKESFKDIYIYLPMYIQLPTVAENCSAS